MIKRIILIFVFMAGFLSAQVLEPGSVAIKLNGGTLGFGGELIVTVVDQLNVKAGFNLFTFPYSYDEKDAEVEADVDLTLSSISLLADFYPWAESVFYFTGGLLINNNAIDLDITPTKTYSVGVRTFSKDEVGKMTGVADFSKVNPYIGLGWGKVTRNDSRVSFNLDLGMIYQNSPKFNFDATGMIKETEDEDEVFEDSLKDFKFFH